MNAARKKEEVEALRAQMQSVAYHISKLIGSGCYGAVFLGKHTSQAGMLQSSVFNPLLMMQKTLGLLREVHFKTKGHPHITNLIEVLIPLLIRF